MSAAGSVGLLLLSVRYLNTFTYKNIATAVTGRKTSTGRGIRREVSRRRMPATPVLLSDLLNAVKFCGHKANRPIRRSTLRQRRRVPVRQSGLPNLEFRSQPGLNRFRIGYQSFHPLDQEFGSDLADLVSVLSNCRQPRPE